MSWSVSGVGKPEALAKKLETEFEKITYLQGPEAELKDIASKLVATALSASTGVAVQISANGHAGTNGDQKYQTVLVKIDPIYGFVE